MSALVLLLCGVGNRCKCEDMREEEKRIVLLNLIAGALTGINIIILIVTFVYECS